MYDFIEKTYQISQKPVSFNTFLVIPQTPDSSNDECAHSRFTPDPQNGSQNIGWGEKITDETIEQIRRRGFIIGFDSEWYQISEGKNYILSYQFWFQDFNKGLIINNKGDERKLDFTTILKVIELFIRQELIPRKQLKKPLYVFIAHFSYAEMQSLEDIRTLWSEGSFISIKNAIVNLIPTTFKYKDKHYNHKEVRILFRDTYLLTNDALSNIANYVDAQKLEIDYDKSRMDTFREEQPILFYEYGIHDALISARFYANFQEKMVQIGAKWHNILTMSKIGEFYFLKILKQHNLDLDYLGYEKHTIKYEDKKGKLRTTTENQLKLEVMDGVLSYRGGRNETYFQLIDSEDAVWFDYDIKNAYPTSMLGILDVDWNSEYQITKLEDLTVHSQGYLLLEFVFHNDVAYPLFAINHDEKGLIFPQKGKCWVTAIEAYAAYKNGWLKSYEIKNSRLWKNRDTALVPDVVQYLVQKRSKFAKGTLWNYIYKVSINGLYGKLAQGISARRGLDIKESVRISEIARSDTEYSKVFNPVLAAYITGVSRIIVTEYMQYIFEREGDVVINVTTDGFQTKDYAMDEELLRGSPLKITSKFLELRQKYLGQDESIMELKHESAPGEHIAFKTRGYGCVQGKDGDPSQQMLARAGNKINHPNKTLQFAILKHYMITADASTVLTQNRITNPQSFIADDIDLTNYQQQVGVNFDFDWKRKPDLVWSHDFYGIIQLSTKPWESVEEFDAFFNDFKVWQKDTIPRNKIRTLDQWHQFLAYRQSRQLAKATTGQIKSNDPKEVMRGIIVYAMLMLEYRNRDIVKMLGINTKFVEKRKASKTFQNLRDGQKTLQKITPDQTFISIFNSITGGFSCTDRDNIYALIFK